MAKKSGFSFVRGVVEASTRMSKTDVSGAGGRVHSSTSYFSEIRLRTEKGALKDWPMTGTYAPGDIVAIVVYKGKEVGEKNISTGDYWVTWKTTPGLLKLVFWLLAIFMAMVFVGGVFLTDEETGRPYREDPAMLIFSIVMGILAMLLIRSLRSAEQRKNRGLEILNNLRENTQSLKDI